MTTDPIAAARALIAAQPDLLYRCGLCPDECNCHPHHDMSMSGEYILCDECEDLDNPAGVPDPLKLIATLADALEVERAKVAAVYEAAATWLVGTGIAGDGDGDPLASCIRAIPPANAQAALDKLLIEARLEGWRFGRDEVVKWLIASGVAGDHDSDPLSSSIRSIPEPKENIHD